MPSGSVGAVVLAAGLSRRMGRPKMTLPWGGTTVIGQVVGTLARCPLDPIVVVTGSTELEVRAALKGAGVFYAHNPDPAGSGMLDSLRIGLHALSDDVQAALVVLGDQPQIQADVVEQIIRNYAEEKPALIVPSYRMRRGHPWLIERRYWRELFDLQEGHTLRDFLTTHADEITYLNVDTPSVLSDLDTPEDYQRTRPGGSAPVE